MFRKKLRRRISYLPTFLSISLVLFLSGLFALFLYHANTLKEKARESVQFSIYFKEDASQKDIVNLQKTLQKKPNIKEAKYISKEEGLKSMQAELGVNAEELLGFNPLPNALDVYFLTDFIEEDSLKMFQSGLEDNPLVREVAYNQLLVKDIDKNVRIIGVVLLSLALLMGFVSIALINNTIRLTLYAKRFLIKSMQLVGATQSFIRKPFILRGFFIGFLSSILACFLLTLTLYLFTKKFPDLALLQDFKQLAILFFCIIVLGVIISMFSSYFAINKYLKMKLDDLF